MNKLNRQHFRSSNYVVNARKKSLAISTFIKPLRNKTQIFIKHAIKKLNIDDKIHGIITDALIAFTAITASTIMRMGYGIFEYSLISLLLNGLTYSLITGAVFVKNGIISRDRTTFSMADVRKIFINSAVINITAYPVVMIADKHKCLSSSIMFINFCVFIVLQLCHRIRFKQYTVSNASDVLIGNPQHISNVISKNGFKTSGFKPMGSILTEDADYFDVKSISSFGKLNDIQLILNSLEAMGTMPKRFIIIDPISADKIKLLKEYTARNGIMLLQIFSSGFES